MDATLQLTDPVFRPVARRSGFDKLALQLINDERDLPFIRHTILLTLIVVPVSAYFYLSGHFSWWIAFAYWVVVFAALLGPYILMLHNISHRPLFKPEYKWASNYIGWFLGPFFGETPNTYYVHHVGMHHPENNLEDDLSCTMPYQRDSLIAFLRYLVRFYVIGFPELALYMWRRRRFKLFRRMIIGELTFYLVMMVLLWLDWRATVVLFIAPLIVGRFAMMAGNWGQHAFIDRDDPGNCYRNSITCINSGYNRRCFNDGYHIGHHIKQNRHWTEMPEDFLRNRETYLREGAIVFRKIDFVTVWLILMLKRYDWLANFYVPLGADRPSHDEIVRLLRRRTARISHSEGAAAVAV